MSRHVSSKKIGTLVQTASAMASGAINFIVIQALIILLPDASVFSQVSTVFIMFSLFQVWLDMGSHAEFLSVYPRLQAGQRRTAVRQLLHTRLAFAAIGYLCAIAHGLGSGFSMPVLLCSLIYVLSLFPLALASVWDTLCMAESRFVAAIALRSIRLLSSLVFLGYWLWNDNGPIVAPFLGYFLSTVLLLLLAYLLVRGPLRVLLPSDPDGSVLELNFYRSFVKTGIFSGIIVLFLTLYHSVTVHVLTEFRMGRINHAIAICTPFVIILQSLGSMGLTRLFQSTREHLLEYRQRAYTLIGVMTAAGGLGGGLLASAYLLRDWPGLRLIFAADEGSAQTPIFLGSYLIGQIVSQMAVPLYAVSIFSGRQKLGSMLLIVLGVLGVPLLYQSLALWGEAGYLHFLIVYWGAIAASFLIAMHVMRMSPAAS